MEKDRNRVSGASDGGQSVCSKVNAKATLHKIARLFVQVAVFTFNLFIAAVFLNLVAWGVIKTWSAKSASSWNPIVDRYGAPAAEKAFREVYGEMPRQEIDKLLGETWGRPVAFNPFTLFRERPFKGTYVNVHEAGFRYTKDQAPWPPLPQNVTIFVFGGSTTFGYGVADWQTVPSAIQEALRQKFGPTVAVYNFGTNSFYSSQERAYYHALLSDGFKPNVAVFIDGLNEFFYIENVPKYAAQLSDMLDIIVAQKPAPSAWVEAGKQLPLVQLFQMAGRKKDHVLAHEDFDPNRLSERDVAYFNRPEIINKVLSTYLMNKQLVEGTNEKLGIKSLFVWQPVPSYNFDLKRHLFPKDCKKMFSAFGYPKMREFYQRGDLGSNFLWAADLQTTAPDPIYLDMVHYTPQFSRVLGETIARSLEPTISVILKNTPQTP